MIRSKRVVLIKKKSNMRSICISMLLLFIIAQLSAQGEDDHLLMQENRVHTVQAYYFETEGAVDSTLMSTEVYNQKGRRTSVEYYDSLGVRNRYEYFYHYDTIRCRRRSYYRGQLSSRTKIIYNERGQEIQSIGYIPGGYFSGKFSEFKYNDDYQLEDIKIYLGNAKLFHQEIEYHLNGTPKRVKSQIGLSQKCLDIPVSRGYQKVGNRNTGDIPKWIKFKDRTRKTELRYYDEAGKLTQEVGARYHVESKILDRDRKTGLTCQQVDTKCFEELSTFSINGMINIESGTTMREELYRSKNGLIAYEKQYLITAVSSSSDKSYFRPLGMLKYVHTYYED